MARRTIGYTVGSALVALGILGFMVEVSEGKISSGICSGYVLAVVYLTCGICLLLGVWSHYGGGFWSFLGATLVAVAIIFIGFAVDEYMRGKFPVRAILPVAVLCGSGCYCLRRGHIRHRQKKGHTAYGFAHAS